VDTFPKRNSSASVIWLLAFFYVGLGSSLTTGQTIPFAEDLFPELHELLDLAMTQSSKLELATLRVEEREGDLDAMKGSRRPRAQLYAQLLGSYETRDDIENRFRGSGNANLKVTQPLYQWDALERRETIARHRVTLEELETERTGSSQFMQLRQAYLHWVLMRERRTILEQSIGLSESFVEARRKLVEAGVSSEQDVLEMEAQLMENRESLAYVENSISDLETSFKRLAGPGVDLQALRGDSLDLILPMSDEDFAELSKFALSIGTDATDPLTARFDLLEEIEDEQLAILDKRNWPSFDLVAGIFTDQLDSVNQEDYFLRTQYYAGLQISWNIFDGWQTDGFKRSALARKRTWSVMREESGNDNLNTIETLLANLRLNLKQIEARSKRESLLERRVELLQQQVQQNQASGVDLMEGEIDYLEVRRRLMEARVSYLMNLMELGVLIDEDPAITRYRDEG